MSPDNLKPRVGVGVMILREGKVLLGKRHEDPAKADSELHGEGTWTMPGGKLDFQESFEAGACRETLEETGLKIKPEDLQLISLANDIWNDAHFVTVGFLCEKVDGEPQVREPDEITEWQWFALDALPEKLFFPSREVLERYLAGKIYPGFSKNIS